MTTIKRQRHASSVHAVMYTKSSGACNLIDSITDWLPGMDSNHDSRLQRPLSYH